MKNLRASRAPAGMIPHLLLAASSVLPPSVVASSSEPIHATRASAEFMNAPQSNVKSPDAPQSNIKSTDASRTNVKSADAPQGNVKPIDATPLITWRELTDHPGRYTNKHVRIVLQFQARVPTWNPYLTRFGPRDFDAFQFWGDEQRLWILGEFQAPPVRLFARRESVAGSALLRAQSYARFELGIVVRDIFLDQPWSEVESVMPLAERISEGTLIHASRATELLESKSWKLAENELDQALIGSLPPDAKSELERLRDECRQMIAPKGKPESKPVPLLRNKAAPTRSSD
jgi:hypothetical protein